MDIRDRAIEEVERLVDSHDPAAPVHTRARLAAYIAAWAVSQEPTEAEIEAAARALWEQHEPRRAGAWEREYRARRKHYIGLAEDALTAVCAMHREARDD